MKKMYSLLLFIVCTTLFFETSAQSSKGGSLSDLAFLEGRWKATFEGRNVDGVWLAAEGDNFTGMMRMNKDGKGVLYEILAYEQTADGLISRVKHFKPGLIGLEEKDKQDRYHFLEAGDGWVNLQKEGEASRIRYERRSKDQFVILRGLEKDGKWSYTDRFVFNRVK